MTYQIGKKYYIDGHYYECVLLTKAYATLQRVDRPTVTVMVRASNSV